MSSQEQPTARLHRSFSDLRDELASNAEKYSMLYQMGWKGGFDWEVLLRSRRILIISEAGSGKTYECRTERTKLWERGECAIYFDLAELAKNNLKDLLTGEEDQRFTQWLASKSEVATFFLDSIDELKLTLGSFETALRRLNRAVSGQLGRTRIVITTRPVPIDAQLIRQLLPVPPSLEFVESETSVAEQFADVAMGWNREKAKEDKSKDEPPEWRIVELMPLSREQIRQMAIAQGVEDPDELLRDILRRKAEDFVRRPQDLIELCTDWRDHHRVRLHGDQVKYNIEIKLKPRLNPGERVQLSADKALEGASRLALAALLTRRLTIRHSAEADISGVEGIALNPTEILPDWTADEQTTLLERSLFGFASYGRVRFHHRSVIEFLAAYRLAALLGKGMPIKAVKRLLFAETPQGIKVVKPSMRPVAAWLALSQPSIFAHLLECGPEVLLEHGDPASLTPTQRGQALRAYVERYGRGGWRGLHVPRIQVHRFASNELAPVVIDLWARGIENPEVRELLIELIAAAPMPLCADLVYVVAIDSGATSGERMDALEALVNIGDFRLPEIVKSIESPSSPWTSEQLKGVIARLFPRHIAADSLCRLLSRITESRRSVGDVGWILSGGIAEIEAADDLNVLCSGLTDLAVLDVKWDARLHCVVSPRRHLIKPLAETCLRLFEKGLISDSLIRSSVISIRLSDEETYSNDDIESLKQALSKVTADQRAEAFWESDTFTQIYYPKDELLNRWIHAAFRGVINLNPGQDSTWCLACLADKARKFEERALMLEVAMRCLWNREGEWHVYLTGLKDYVVDCPDLLGRIDEWLKPASTNSEELAQVEEEAKKQQKKFERKQARSHASWVEFWTKVAKDPQAAFSPDKSGNTAWNLWRAMSRSGSESRSSGWNRHFIETHFNKEVADQLRTAMMECWRNDRPTLRSERPDHEKNTYLIRWQFGLVAISAEAEDPDWSKKLCAAEAELAVRYAPLEMSGFPSWLEGLAIAHPSAVEFVLGSELVKELDEPASPGIHPMLLQNVNHAAASIAVLFLPRLLAWLEINARRIRDGDDEALVADRIRRVAYCVLKFGDDQIREKVCQISLRQLSGGLESLLATAWLPVLIKLDAVSAIDLLEKGLDATTAPDPDKGVAWLGLLFGDRSDELPINLSAPKASPDLLLRLLRLAYMHVRPQDDIEHDGVYSPGPRDHAERMRSALLQALLDAKGPDAWAAKLEMARDPLFSHLSDRVLQLAREVAAVEVDGSELPESEVVNLDRYAEVSIMTSNDMFSLMVDRLDDLGDLLLRDESPRAAWAGITDETTMRRVIAHELNTSANHVYKVDQESVTADEKRTDIRLRSTASDQQAVIELKLGEKDWSGRILRETIKSQLVTRYMAPESSRAGCLLVTISTDRRWEHPDTGEQLDAAGLEDMLNEEARRIMEELGYELRLTARVLDLRPRPAAS